MFSAYGEHGAPDKLQRKVLNSLEERLRNELREGASVAAKRRFISASGKAASYWLTQHPSEQANSIDNLSIVAALRHRLGLPPADDLPRNCPFKGCHQDATAFDHFHACAYLRGSVCTHRHNKIVRVLRDLSKEAGMYCQIEPHLNPRTGVHSDDRRKRPDAIISGAEARWMVDVSITTPTCQSFLLDGEGKKGRAESREQQKTLKYGAIATAERCTFIPFVLESYGTMGTQAYTLLKAMAKQYAAQAFAHEDEDTQKAERAYLSRALRAISFALQWGNAYIGLDGASRSRDASGMTRVARAPRAVAGGDGDGEHKGDAEASQPLPPPSSFAPPAPPPRRSMRSEAAKKPPPVFQVNLPPPEKEEGAGPAVVVIVPRAAVPAKKQQRRARAR